jgi:hypothetical protein
MFIYLFRSFIMKSIRIATIAVLATVSMGAFAAKDSGDRFELGAQATVSAPSTLSRAQVQAEAIKANRDNAKRGYIHESDSFYGVPAVSSSTLTRDAVRAEITKARSTAFVIENNS